MSEEERNKCTTETTGSKHVETIKSAILYLTNDARKVWLFRKGRLSVLTQIVVFFNIGIKNVF